MPGSLRTGALVTAILLAAIWSAPALVLPQLASRLAASRGFELELEGARPALPWGVTLDRAVVVGADGSVEIRGLSARLLRSGMRVEGSVGDGTILVRTGGLTLRDGLVRLQAVPLEALDGLVPGAFTLRGAADGVYRFGGHDALEATVSRGAVVLRTPLAVELPFAQLVVTAAREDDGAWRVDFADLRGPPLSGSARGRIDAHGQLALRVEISQLEEPARSVFGMAHLPTEPLPYTAELGGTLERPTFSPVVEDTR